MTLQPYNPFRMYLSSLSHFAHCLAGIIWFPRYSLHQNLNILLKVMFDPSLGCHIYQKNNDFTNLENSYVFYMYGVLGKVILMSSGF
jgi:hypothetical protein